MLLGNKATITQHQGYLIFRTGPFQGAKFATLGTVTFVDFLKHL